MALTLGRGFDAAGEDAGAVVVETHPDNAVTNTRMTAVIEVTPGM